MMIKKVLSILDWIKTMSVSLLGFLTAPIVYPILYTLREDSDIRDRKPFWYYFDDEDGNYGTDWFRESLPYGNKTDRWSRFRIAYKWSALRNPAWNLQASLKPIAGEKVLVKTWGEVEPAPWGNEPTHFLLATFKYVNENGEYKDNKGEYLSKKYSWLGKNFTWYKIGNKLYWRMSYANNLISKLWVEFHLGVSNHRYTFRLKFKWNLKVR